MQRALFLAALLLGVSACAHRAGTPAGPTDPPLRPLLIDGRGITMPLDKVVTKVDYRPWIPPGNVLAYAVIPPLGNDDTPQHRGVAVEYQSGDQAMLLSEWPKQNFTLLFMRSDITFAPCMVVHYKADGVAWTTRGRLAMTLQPDGDVNSRAVDAEAQRLIAAGACD
jgi:hypothetical protein